MEAFPELILTPEVPMLHQLSESDYSIASSFWRTYDRRISTGGASMVGVRTIIDAMVDDVVTTGAATGWRVDVGSGTFNDVLGSANSLHPIVTAFARAHVEGAHVILAPEHVWLAVLQGVAAVIRHTGTTSKRDQRFDSSDSPDLDDVWRVLRESSDVPMTCLASSGHEVRMFGATVNDRHALYNGRGAAPLAMAAAAAGSGAGVEYGRIGRGGRTVAWQPQLRRTNPAWVSAVSNGVGVSGLRLAGSLQAWAALCVLTRQLKALYSGRSSACDWWLHRVHLLSRDLADYYAAQDDDAGGELSTAWRKWIEQALFDGHSGPPRGARLDGWLAALFPIDADAEFIHGQDRWWVDWDKVPCGVDLLRVDVGSVDQHRWLNLYSGFVGVQQLSQRSGGGAVVRDHAKTLVDDVLPEHTSDRERAIAPLVGWALDK
ncbi:hypothetical protein GGI21_004023 [Coemansia aciculifera]|nr:hypothetical protein GGI21_004023 [Coemansia aciculifera]